MRENISSTDEDEFHDALEEPNENKSQLEKITLSTIISSQPNEPIQDFVKSPIMGRRLSKLDVNIVDLTNLIHLRRWILGFVVARFDLDFGQMIEYMYSIFCLCIF